MKTDLYFLLSVVIIFAVISTTNVFAGEVTYSEQFSTGSVLSADQLTTTFEQIKSAVDDNAQNKAIGNFSQVDGFNGVVLQTTNLTTVQSVSITPPSSGTVLVTFAATARLIHPSTSTANPDPSMIQYAIIDTEAVTVIPQYRQLITIPLNYPTGTIDQSMSAIRSYSVAGGQTYTYYARAVVSFHPFSVGSGFFHTVMNPTMQVMFVPD